MNIGHTVRNLSIVLFLCSYACCLAGQQDSRIQMILDILRGNDPDLQAVAIASVKEMPGTEVTEALAKELPNLSAAAQVQLLSALGDRGDGAALPAVVTAAKAADQSVRIAALRALGQLGDASVVTILAESAAAATPDEQKAARDSLYRLRGSKIDDTILAGISKAEPKTRIELISSVGQRNITAGVNVLLETAKDSDRKVRLESLKVLKVVAGPERLPVLIDLLMKVNSPLDRSEAERTVAAVAHKIEAKGKQADAVLAVLPSVKDVNNRSSLLIVLGKIGDDAGLPLLRDSLGNDNPDIKGSAIRALADWPTSAPASDLLRVAQSSEGKLHRILALRGCIRLLGVDGSRPPEEVLEMYKKAMALAPDAEEKKRVLSGLGGIKSPVSLEMAAGYLDDEVLHLEAALAVIKISQAIRDGYPEQTKALLKKVVEKTQNDSVRRQAQEALNPSEGSNAQPEN